jgi:glycosyltransferase involved in cell wall biosynthesis
VRILIAAASFSSELSGVQRHAFNLTRCLLAHPEVSSVELVIAPWQQELTRSSGLEASARLNLHIPDIRPRSLSRNLWYYRQLPLLARQCGAELVHLTYPAPVDARAFSCPTVVTLHDLYPYDIPSNFGFPKVYFNRWILQQCLRNVDSIACVSDFTHHQLSRYVPRSVWSKAVRIYNSVEPAHEGALQSPIRDWKGVPFLLCIAQHRRNKNIPFLLQVMQRMIRTSAIDPSTQLVIVGIAGPESQTIRRAIAHLDLGRNVLLMEGLSELELQWCYSNTGALLAPSTIEGFGLPVAEALLAGCRIVCSDIPAFRELGGDRCRYVPLDQHAETAFAHAIAEILLESRKDPHPMPQLAGRAVADQSLHLYKMLLSSTEEGLTYPNSTSLSESRP